MPWLEAFWTGMPDSQFNKCRVVSDVKEILKLATCENCLFTTPRLIFRSEFWQLLIEKPELSSFKILSMFFGPSLLNWWCNIPTYKPFNIMNIKWILVRYALPFPENRCWLLKLNMPKKNGLVMACCENMKHDSWTFAKWARNMRIYIYLDTCMCNLRIYKYRNKNIYTVYCKYI